MENRGGRGMDARGGSSDNEHRAFESVPRFRKQRRSRVFPSRKSGEKDGGERIDSMGRHRFLAPATGNRRRKKKEKRRNGTQVRGIT